MMGLLSAKECAGHASSPMAIIDLPHADSNPIEFKSGHNSLHRPSSESIPSMRSDNASLHRYDAPPDISRPNQDQRPAPVLTPDVTCQAAWGRKEAAHGFPAPGAVIPSNAAMSVARTAPFKPPRMMITSGAYRDCERTAGTCDAPSDGQPKGDRVLPNLRVASDGSEHGHAALNGHHNPTASRQVQGYIKEGSKQASVGHLAPCDLSGRSSVTIYPPDLQGLSFPSLGPGNLSAPACRQISIATRFLSPLAYVDGLASAVVEEINLQIADAARPFISIAQRSYLLPTLSQRRDGGNTSAMGPLKQEQHGSSFQGRAPLAPKNIQGRTPSGAAELERVCSQSRVPYFSSCTLGVWRQTSNRQASSSAGKKNNKAKRRRKGGGGEPEDEIEDDEDEAEPEAVPSTRYFLTVPGIRARLANSCRCERERFVTSECPLICPLDLTRDAPLDPAALSRSALCKL